MLKSAQRTRCGRDERLKHKEEITAGKAGRCVREVGGRLQHPTLLCGQHLSMGCNTVVAAGTSSTCRVPVIVPRSFQETSHLSSFPPCEEWAHMSPHRPYGEMRHKVVRQSVLGHEIRDRIRTQEL